MFKATKAFSSFSVNDVPAAKAFYSETLGLEVSEDQGMLNLKIAGSNPIMIYPKDNHVPATYTILNFPVDNIEQAVAELTGRGVRFEHYDGDVQTDEKGIFTAASMSIKQAWFKDPAGNIISVLETT
ncbi:MAG: VOC family protein [Anaerolineae bacterium]|nr:VOC family protein [Anaerolineae bacterium]